MASKILDNNYLLRLFNQKGVHAGLKDIKITDIIDPTIRIIARTIQFSEEKIIEELESRTSIKK
jgi:hypothetical protein